MLTGPSRAQTTNPTLPQGGNASFDATGTQGPESNGCEIVSPAGTVLAHLSLYGGTNNGWTVSVNMSGSYYSPPRFTVTAPADAPVGSGYMVDVSNYYWAQGAAPFDVVAGSNPTARVPQGGSATFDATSTQGPESGAAEIRNPAGTVIATFAAPNSGTSNGWTLSASGESYGAMPVYTITAPADAPPGDGYQVRSASWICVTGSASFAVVAGGNSSNPTPTPTQTPTPTPTQTPTPTPPPGNDPQASVPQGGSSTFDATGTQGPESSGCAIVSPSGTMLASFNIYGGTNNGWGVAVTTSNSYYSPPRFTVTAPADAPLATGYRVCVSSYYWTQGSALFDVVAGSDPTPTPTQTPTSTPPPSGLTPMTLNATLGGTYEDYQQAHLSWSSYPALGFSAYRLYRATHEGVSEADTLVTTITNPGQVAYDDWVQVAPGTTLYYRVYGLNQAGQSLSSNEVSITIGGATPTPTPTTTPPPAPTAVTLNVPQAVGSSRVDLQACKLEYSIVSPK